MRILIIAGDASAVQGWGDLKTTERMNEVLNASGKKSNILYVNNYTELIAGLNKYQYDIVWSSLYHISDNSNYVGMADHESWVADILDEKGIPYIGPGAQTMKNLIDKSMTHKILFKTGVPLPVQFFVKKGDPLPATPFPSFVKPCFESESTGVSEESVVHSQAELKRQLEYVHETFKQPAVVEEYLPGDELTVAMIGNGKTREFLPVLNIIDRVGVKKYPIVTVELKIKDLISFKIQEGSLEESREIGKKAAEALGCYDHIRIDMRNDVNGKLKVIEVNGIPGLNPIKSRSLHIHSLFYPVYDEEENFKVLINKIVDSALARYGLLCYS